LQFFDDKKTDFFSNGYVLKNGAKALNGLWCHASTRLRLTYAMHAIVEFGGVGERQADNNKTYRHDEPTLKNISLIVFKFKLE